MCSGWLTFTIVNHTDQLVYLHVLKPTRQPLGPVAIDDPMALSNDAFTAKTRKALRTRLLVQVISTLGNMSSKLHYSHRRFRNYLTDHSGLRPDFILDKMVYVERPPLSTLPTHSNAGNYNKLLPSEHGPFRIIHVTEHTFMGDQNSIANIISVDGATPLWKRLNIHVASNGQKQLWKTDRLFMRHSTIKRRELLSQGMKTTIQRRDYRLPYTPTQRLLTKESLTQKRQCTAAVSLHWKTITTH